MPSTQTTHSKPCFLFRTNPNPLKGPESVVSIDQSNEGFSLKKEKHVNEKRSDGKVKRLLLDRICLRVNSTNSRRSRAGQRTPRTSGSGDSTCSRGVSYLWLPPIVHFGNMFWPIFRKFAKNVRCEITTHYY